MSIDIQITKRLKEYTLRFEFHSQRQQTALLGASGSGKSMILKCIAGIETPDEGYIRINGRTLFDQAKKINCKPQKRRVGYLFQNYALFPNFTVEENIACVLPKKKRAQVADLLARFDLTGIAKHYGEQLSGGQQQRVALARLIASEPEILLLDEPFSALDTFLKEKVELEMKHFLAQYAGDVLLVTHNRNEAYRLCEDLVIIDQGQNLEAGPLKDIFSHPRFLATSKLTGCKNFSPIKQLDGQHLFAKDWGLTLKVPQPLTPNVTHIGIRAHCFKAVENLSGENCFPIQLLDQTETPFEWRLLCQTPEGQQPLWWKVNKEQWPAHFSGFLHIAPDEIQLLETSPSNDERKFLL